MDLFCKIVETKSGWISNNFGKFTINTMTRAIAESTNSLSVFFLKKHGYLPQTRSHRYGGIKWARGYTENKINFWVNIEENGGSVELIYAYTNYQSGEKTDMKYRVPLTTTPCPYGGRRYWFLCPLSSRGVSCRRRVAIIYSVGKWFGCRDCANIAYQAQFYGGSIHVGFVSEPDVEKAYMEIKREYYKGKPTRKYKRYLRLMRKMDNFKARVTAKYGIEF